MRIVIDTKLKFKHYKIISGLSEENWYSRFDDRTTFLTRNCLLVPNDIELCIDYLFNYKGIKE
ncbi:hypothetical protein D3C75_622950 [compost metagenome]